MLAGLGFLVGCQDPDYPASVPATGPSTESSKILFIHASADAPNLNGLVNNTQVGNAMSLGQASGYGVVPVGSSQIKASAATGDLGGVIGSGSIIYRAGATNQNNFTFVNVINYTVIVTDTLNRPKPSTTGATNPGGPQFLGPIIDNLTAPASGKSGIRFFHTAAGAPSVYITFVGPATTSFSNVAYRNSTATFTSSTSGSYTVTVRTGSLTGTVIATTTANLTDGKLYSILLTGKVVSGAVKVPYAVALVQHN